MKDMTPGALAYVLILVISAFTASRTLGVLVAVGCVIWAAIDYSREKRDRDG
ncbi:hypothetical protein [Mesorhizobium sp. WSM3862]|uniref:hypothetical protein n=1 Tax=Mesorhizobium sp. WSM3862 TaxID=632858 RepID=UPI0015965BF2|nr:hypothetical protein [Mesorhizobium sp. WSM3862]